MLNLPLLRERNIVRKKTHFFFRLYRARSEVTYPGPIGPRTSSTRAWGRDPCDAQRLLAYRGDKK